MDRQKANRRRLAVMDNALTVLAARAGGSVTIPRDEFLEVAERYGGATKVTLVMEQAKDSSFWLLTLVSKPVQNAGLPS